MSRIQIIGILLLLAGVMFYFIVEGEPYTTASGFIGGIGLGAILFGHKITARYNK